MEDLSKPFALNPDVIFTYLDDEAVLMKPDGHKMYGLSPIGTKTWKILEQKSATEDELMVKLCNTYAVEQKELIEDLKAFLNNLLREQFIYETIG